MCLLMYITYVSTLLIGGGCSPSADEILAGLVFGMHHVLDDKTDNQSPNSPMNYTMNNSSIPIT